MANQNDNFGNNQSNRDESDMTVREAGHKGGQRVRELIDEGKQAEGRGSDNEE